MENKYYAIYSISMTNHLVRLGNDIIKVGDNEKNPKLKVFIFCDNTKFRTDMASFIKRQGV